MHAHVVTQSHTTQRNATQRSTTQRTATQRTRARTYAHARCACIRPIERGVTVHVRVVTQRPAAGRKCFGFMRPESVCAHARLVRSCVRVVVCLRTCMCACACEMRGEGEVYTCRYTGRYTCLDTCLCTRPYTCLYTCGRTCLYTCLRTCLYTCVRTYTCLYAWLEVVPLNMLYTPSVG